MGTSWISRKGWNLRKVGVDLEKGGMIPLTNYVHSPPPRKILGPPLNLAPPQNLIFCSGPPQLFWSEIFKSPLKLGGCYHDNVYIFLCITLVTTLSTADLTTSFSESNYIYPYYKWYML